MFKFKCSIASLLIIGNSLVFAGTMGAACVPGDVSIPCDKAGWSFGGQALYLQPSFGGNGLGYSAFSYGTDSFGTTVGANNPNNTITNVKPEWSWGFQIEGAYKFGSGSDLDLNWYHQNNTTSKYLPHGSLFSGNAPALYAGFITVAPSWDAVNIELGQHFDFDETKMMRLHAGIDYSRVKTVFTNYPRLRPDSSPLFITTDNISFNGFGPRVGDDFTYLLGHGLGLYAKGAASLLIGTTKQNVSGYQNLAFPQSFSTGNYVQTNRSVVITELEAKLGLKYDYPTAQGIWGVDVGYMWVNYFNALVSQTGSGLAGSASSSSTAANFNLNGLYFGLKWVK
ncbi:Lpg1974 family pore-forming outer membrane protein [Legionella quateirensis]|uniref:Major outer membrane protein n=1 Tax=Legionella quateirensis TaxID=45072 RepID=A0A378KRE3_9GAMM|nr:Lpg1974 family pore-forming outer membrane protein [Legionella quateirensis]KTD42360.1 major outer membrane protein [Legionella quateirensis]STY17153.1 major outer membrane protein [Legionella quateirensis]